MGLCAFHRVFESLFSGLFLALDLCLSTPKNTFFWKIGGSPHNPPILRRSNVWCDRGIFLRCFSLFWAREIAGETPQKQNLKKKMGGNRKKKNNFHKSPNRKKNTKIKIAKKILVKRKNSLDSIFRVIMK